MSKDSINKKLKRGYLTSTVLCGWLNPISEGRVYISTTMPKSGIHKQYPQFTFLLSSCLNQHLENFFLVRGTFNQNQKPYNQYSSKAKALEVKKLLTCGLTFITV